MMRSLLFFSIVVLAMAACTKTEVIENEVNPPISEVPAISIAQVKPLNVTALEDPIEFVLFYQDGDGDLGFYEADSLSLYITDNRINISQGFYVPPLAPSGASVAIQGNLKIQLDNTIMVDTNSTSESVTFSIRLKDRAGHWSNTATSDPITVVP